MKLKQKIIRWGLIIISALSFWSSGVVLVRVLNSYNVWNGGILLASLFILSIPLVYFSIISVEKMFRALHVDPNSSITYIIALVVLIHALMLSTYPSVYSFTRSC